MKAPVIRRWAAALAVGAVILLAPAVKADSDLARAYRVIASKSFVDLTHSFGPQTPVWSGFGQAKFSPASDPKTHEPYTIPKDGFRTTYYEMVGQYGTHVDPPAHFDEKGITMDAIPLKQMILRLIVLDDTPYLGEGSEPRLLGRRPEGLGEEAWPRAARLIRRAAHRHVQGLGQQSRTLQARSRSRPGRSRPSSSSMNSAA